VSSSRKRDPALDPRPALSPPSDRRDLVALVSRLVRERSWNTLTALFVSIGTGDEVGTATLSDLDGAARLVGDSLAAGAAPRRLRGSQADQLHALCLAIADALVARTAHPPLAELERRALGRAAELFERGGDHRRAALAFEELGADTRAAEAWGALGDLERMEAAHAREDHRETARRGTGDLLRRFEELHTGGERLRALAAIAVVTGVEEASTVRQRAAGIESRLCRGRAVSLRAPGGPWIRLALLPTEIGRDPAAGVALRDPSVSRRHARLVAGDDGVHLEDTGSRGGIAVGGARLDTGVALPLRGPGELALGPTTVLRFQAMPATVSFEGLRGLDRGLRALVGTAPLSLAPLFPPAEGLAIEIAGEIVRLTRRADRAVRVGGHFIGPGCDLLHGDLIEIPSTGLRLEVQ
jgi:FHA domain